MKSIFIVKEITPTTMDLKRALATTFNFWQALADFTKKSYPTAIELWKYSSEKNGWSFQIKDKKRVIVYLLPRDKFFKVALVFGQKAVDEILKSNISENLISEIKNAKVYAEGRGIRIDVTSELIVEDIMKLISIKISH